MSKKNINILLAITNGLWLIDKQSAEQLGANVASVLAGEKLFSIDHKSNPEVLIVEKSEGSYYASTTSSAKPGSVAVISITGPIMKEDNCGDPGTKTYESLILNAAQNPNITGIVLVIDSPGGTVSGTESLSNVIKSVDKPVVTLAEDLMASAAYWIGSSSDYVFASTETTRIGSIGTMLSFADMQPYWEKQGVKFHDIYATESSNKNKDFAEARKGNYAEIINNTLDPLNKVFTGHVKEMRGNNLNAKETLTGKVFVASEALKHGLIDSIGNLNDAIAKVNELSISNISSSEQVIKSENQNQNMKKITLLASHAALLALCGASIEAGKDSVDVELTDELVEKINQGLTGAAETATELATSKTNLEKANADLATATQKVTSLETEVASLKEENTKLGASSAGTTNTTKTGADEIETAEKDEFLTSVDVEKKKFNA